MTCLHCAKKIPLIRRWSDPQFCCDEHRRAHLEEATHHGLARLLENPVPAKFAAVALPPTGAGTADGLVHSMGELRFGRRLQPPVTQPSTVPPPAPADPETPHLAAPRYYQPPLDSAVGCEVALRECSARPFPRPGPVWTFPPRRFYRLAPPSRRRPDSVDPVDDPECQATWWPDEARWNALPTSLGPEVQARRPLLRGARRVAAPAAAAASGCCAPEPAGEFGFAAWPAALPAIREEALEVKDIGTTWEPRQPAAAVLCPPAAKAGHLRRRRGSESLRFPDPAPAARIAKPPAAPAAPGFPTCGLQPVMPSGQVGVPPLVPLEPRPLVLAWACPSQPPRVPELNPDWPSSPGALPLKPPATAQLPAHAAQGTVIARFTLTGLRLPGLTGEPDLFLARPDVIASTLRPAEGRNCHFEAGGGWLGMPMALPEPVAAQREPPFSAKSRHEQAPRPAEPAGLQPFLAPAASGALAAADIPAAPVTSLAAESAAQEPAKQAAAAPGILERIRKSGTRISTVWRQAVRQRRRVAAAVRRARWLPSHPPAAGVPEVLQRVWRATPLYARGIMLVVPLMVPTLFYASLQSAAPPSGTFASIREAIRARATVLIEEEFRSGFGAWSGPPGWQSTWARDQAGAAMPGALAILERSRPLGDYRVEFAAQMEKRGLAFALRAADTQNFHAVQFLMVKPGPLPVVHIVRYPVVNGRAGPRTELPMPLALRPDTLYQVTAHVRGDQFIVSVNGQVVDTWTDPLRPTGGIGFFSEKGMAFRLRWVRVVDKDDFLGWLCSQFSPQTVDSISSR